MIREIFEDAAQQQGWNWHSQCHLLLTYIEKLNVTEHFKKFIDDQIAHENNDKTRHYQVEYDLEFWNGDGFSSKQIAYIPVCLAHEISLSQAFKQTTGIDPKHITQWTPGEYWEFNGKNWEPISNCTKGNHEYK